MFAYMFPAKRALYETTKNKFETKRGICSTHVMDTKRRSCGKIIGVATALDWCSLRELGEEAYQVIIVDIILLLFFFFFPLSCLVSREAGTKVLTTCGTWEW